MNIPKWIRPGRARIEEEEKTKAREDARREAMKVFETPLEPREEFQVFNTAYDTRWLRAVVSTIRGMQIMAAEHGSQAPGTPIANEMAARYAALGELEKLLLARVDAANGEGREDQET